ncbi:MAG: YraN family protein [Oscillospiraceae bacterium]|jgi:putative endonuclease|nr:YraN family protein [Oscillospiraceae bacterium]
MKPTQKQSVGGFGEETAWAHLARHGFRLVQYNYRTRFGEVDILAEDGAVLVFAEVKTRRTGAKILGEEAVDFRKQQRLRAAAAQYLAEHPTELQPRFDVLCVDLAPGGQVAEIRWLQDAF